MKIAIAGLGTIGTGVVRLLQKNNELIAARAGQGITIRAVSDPDRKRKRDCDLSGIAWHDDACELINLPDVDLVVELIGGAEGVARVLAEGALKAKKHYVTANKALIAAHGTELAMIAETNDVQLLFEASVAGGIPILKTLGEGLIGNRITQIRGILNGTCNYILTQMQSEGIGFDEALKQAQAKGYAEADPSADIDGYDTANKLAILTALAFGVEPDLKSIAYEGIRGITPVDLKAAAELGYRIKLLGMAFVREGGIEQHVGPCLVPVGSPLASVSGVMNGVMLRGDFVGDLMLEGAGAGAEPTASAVVADIVDVIRGMRNPAFSIATAKLGKIRPPAVIPPARHYIRLQVADKPGVVADIAAILRDQKISIESFIQHGSSATESVPVVMTTHAAEAAAMRRAAEAMAKLAVVAAPPCVMRIED